MALNRAEKKKIRQKRVRRKVKGTPERPRLCVFRSSKHIYAQIIDDTGGVTMASACTLSPELKGKLSSTKDREAAKKVGELVAGKCKEKGIVDVVFDRNGFLYHGRVKAVSDGAREGGLDF